MPYSKVAIIGAGVIGTPIAKALLQEGAKVIVISRPASSSAKDVPAGAKVLGIDTADVSALTAAFKEHEIEVVISTLPPQGLALQLGLGDAAKQSGVKLFLPSEFGFSSIGHTDGLIGQKDQLAEHLKSIGLPTARIFTGLFITFIPWLLALDTGKINVIGKGDKKATFTHPDDISGFVAYVLTHLPAFELEDKIFRLEGEQASLLDVAGYYGSKYPVEHITGLPGDAFQNVLQEVIEGGHGNVADGGTTSNALWPGHHWRGIKEGLGL